MGLVFLFNQFCCFELRDIRPRCCPVCCFKNMQTLLSRSSSTLSTAPCRQRSQQKQHSRDVCVHAASNWQGDPAFKRLMVLPGGAWFLSDAAADAPVYGDSFIMKGREAHAGPRSTATGAICMWPSGSLLCLKYYGVCRHNVRKCLHTIAVCSAFSSSGWRQHACPPASTHPKPWQV